MYDYTFYTFCFGDDAWMIVANEMSRQISCLDLSYIAAESQDFAFTPATIFPRPVHY